jgi:carotenoid 1,2-hydratase
VRESGGRGPRFDETIARNGYAWWYLDALSDDGQYGLSIIGLVGSVFSPFYAEARRQGPTDPLAHCSMNVAVYGPKRNAWAFTEHGRKDVRRDRASLVIGASSMEWEHDTLTVRFEEKTAPLPGRISGVVRIHPQTLSEDKPFVLDSHGHHHWGPIAPIARAEVEMREPGGVHWKGLAYVDTNAGSEPLEDGFRHWNWCRATTKERMIVTYDAFRRNGSRHLIQHAFYADGRTEGIENLIECPLDRTLWGLSRTMRVDRHTSGRLIRTLEDTPFYSRSEVRGSYLGAYAHGVHESLSLDRWKSRIVQFMLPRRMRRASS